MMKKIIAILLVILTVVSLSACSSNTITAEPDIVQIRSICELSTLKCEYNNVAKKTKNSLIGGESKVWIEYKGYVKLGIDMNKVSMSVNGTTVTVTMPQAKVLTVGIIDDTYTAESYTFQSTGLIKTKISTSEKTEIIKEAQDKMKATAESSTVLLTRAQNRAMVLIENYIEQLGQINGVTYTIKWDFID